MPQPIDDLIRSTAPRRTPRAERAHHPRPAAGLLVRYIDATGDAWWLLGLRCERLGGAWSNLGGSLERGETTYGAAIREFEEETRWSINDLGRITELGKLQTSGGEPGARPYTLFIVDATETPDNAWLGWEHDDLAWFPTNSVNELADTGWLYPKFADAWDAVPADLKV